MLLQLLALSGRGAGSGPAGGQPTISALVATPFDGACPVGGFSDLGTDVDPTASASIALSWAISGFNDAQYEIRISTNGAAPYVQPTSDTNYTEGVSGLVHNGPLYPTYKEFNWSVSLVRKSDSAVLQTLTASYAAYYGRCSA